MWCFKNAEPVNSIDLQDRAFQYGDGCFTTARINQGKFTLKARHLLRLKQNCHYLYLQADLSLIEKSLQQLQPQFSQSDGILKIIVSRGVGQRGYRMPDHAADVYVCFYPQAMSSYTTPRLIQAGVLEQVLGMSMPQLVGLKTLNRLEQVLFRHEADQHNWPEALVSDIQGFVVEGISSNCFIYLNDTWITPELRYNGVHGVMRAEILARMEKYKHTASHGFIDMQEIPNIQALFFCNALNPMQIVTHLDGSPLNTQICVELFDTLQMQQID